MATEFFIFIFMQNVRVSFSNFLDFALDVKIPNLAEVDDYNIN